MADFGPNATQLSAPQGAGASVVAPVEERVVNTSMLGTIASAVPAIAQGVGQFIKAGSEDLEKSVLKKYADAENNASQMFKDGGLRSAAQYDIYVRSVRDQFRGAYPELVPKFKQIREEGSFGVAGSITQTIESQEDIVNAERKAASAAGFRVDQSAAPDVQNAQLQDFRNYKYMQTQLEHQSKQLSVESQQLGIQGVKDKALVERDSKQAFGTMNTYVSGRSQTRLTIAMGLRDRINAGTLSPDAARAELMQESARDLEALTALSQFNREAANDFKEVLGKTNESALKIIDPATSANDYKALFERAKSVVGARAVMDDPAVAREAWVLDNMKGSPLLTNLMVPKFLAIAKGESTQVFAEKGETDVLRNVKETMRSAVDNPDMPVWDVRSGKAVEQYIKQIGKEIDNNNPRSFENAAKFFADPVTGRWMASTKSELDSTTVGRAQDVLKQRYEVAVKQTLETRIKEAIEQPRGLGAVGALGRTMTEPGTSARAVSRIDPRNIDIKFSGGGVLFDLRKMPEDPVDRQDAIAAIDELRKSQGAINQLIQINTHMGRSVDYSKDWEQNKHNYLPSVFTAPNTTVEKGGVKFIYIGKGEAFDNYDKSSWKRVDTAK